MKKSVVYDRLIQRDKIFGYKQTRKELFNYAWNKTRNYINSGYDVPRDYDDYIYLLDIVISEVVNNSNSRFYIYG